MYRPILLITIINALHYSVRAYNIYSAADMLFFILYQNKKMVMARLQSTDTNQQDF